MRPAAGNLRASRHPVAAKVPEITVLFWVIKVLTTGMGEATSDYLGKISLVLAGAVGVVGFVVAMWLQFRTRRYVPVVYWFAVMMVAGSPSRIAVSTGTCSAARCAATVSR